MPTISNHQVKQINLTLIPNSGVDINVVETDKIIAKLVDIFPDSKVARTQLPEILFLLDSVNQISVNILQNENRIVIGSNNPSQYTEVQLDNFLKFCLECVKIVNKNDIKAYGFNVSSVLDVDEVEDTGSFLASNLVNKPAAFEQALTSAGVSLTYVEADVRYQLRLDPRFGTDLEPTKSIIVSLNVHRNGSLPIYSELLETCRKDYNDLGQNLVRLLG